MLLVLISCILLTSSAALNLSPIRYPTPQLTKYSAASPGQIRMALESKYDDTGPGATKPEYAYKMFKNLDEALAGYLEDPDTQLPEYERSVAMKYLNRNQHLNNFIPDHDKTKVIPDKKYYLYNQNVLVHRDALQNIVESFVKPSERNSQTESWLGRSTDGQPRLHPQGTNGVDSLPHTFKNYYFEEDSEDGDLIIPLNQEGLKRTRSSTSLDEFFDEPKTKKKQKKTSSTVGRAQKAGGISYISTNADDASKSTHLVKIEIYDLKKLAKVPPNEHWKFADVRTKYYTQEKDEIYNHSKQLIYKITKDVASAKDGKKYFFNN